MPPSSSPASTSTPSGTSGASASATAASRSGRASKRNLSKYSVAVAPDRSVNSPVRWQASRTAEASSACVGTRSPYGAPDAPGRRSPGSRTRHVDGSGDEHARVEHAPGVEPLLDRTEHLDADGADLPREPR